jgi:hypothetical protein
MTAISGLILTTVDKTVFGNKRVHTFKGFVGNGTDTWPAGGVQCPPSNLGLTGVDNVEITGGTLLYQYVYTSGCVQAFSNGTSGLNLIVAEALVPTSGVVIRIRATGYGMA